MRFRIGIKYFLRKRLHRLFHILKLRFNSTGPSGVPIIDNERRRNALPQQRYKHFFILVGLALSLFVRVYFIDFVSTDMVQFLSWFQHLSGEGIHSVRGGFALYLPPYNYFLFMATKLSPPLTPLQAIKAVSIVFDYVCAAYIFRLIRLAKPTGDQPWYASLAFLLTPTVFLNSAAWGQSDVVYVTGLLAFVYFSVANRPYQSAAAFGFALAFKTQAVFLLPMVLLHTIESRDRLRYVTVIFFTYLLMLLPALALGMPPWQILDTYTSQVDSFPVLVAGAPNIYQWLGGSYSETKVALAVVFTAMVAIVALIWIRRVTAKNSEHRAIQIALFFSILLPFFLPKMHERYFFPADIFSIPFAFLYPSYAVVSILIILASFLSYFPFLFSLKILPGYLIALLPLAALGFLIHHLNTRAHPSR